MVAAALAPSARGPRTADGRAPARARALLALEGAGLAAVAVLTTVAVLGEVADRLVGPARWWRPLLFAITVLGLGVTLAGALAAWPRIRRGLAARTALLPPAVGLALVAIALGLAARPASGSASVRSAGCSAARRRRSARPSPIRSTPPTAAPTWPAMAARARARSRLRAHGARGRDRIRDRSRAARRHRRRRSRRSIPRDSADGGRGLFQITAPPAVAVANVRRLLGGDALDPRNERHNALLAAATLRQYLEQMDGDPFLALLAYNIGPQNGGLRAIMAQYGARDFVTMQPYLQQLPRDYPIRVLTAALAYRVRAA